VSEAPIRMLAQRPALLSGPTEAKRLSATAVVALPENGRKSRTGRISEGNPKREMTGLNKWQRTSTIPEDISICTPESSITRPGIKEIDVSSPSFAPFKNSLPKSFFEKSIITALINTITGIEAPAINSVIACTFLFNT